jgi:hypothetical protein
VTVTPFHRVARECDQQAAAADTVCTSVAEPLVGSVEVNVAE